MQPAANGKDLIFYDGTCGLCHRFVKWTLAHDAEGRFRFAPLQGETFREMVPAEQRAKLPDSVAVRTMDGRLLAKSAAAQYVVEQLGLRGRSTLLRVLPRGLADFGYDVIARTRYAVFGKKEEICPLVPPELRVRFLP